jgi:hypothetical protein
MGSVRASSGGSRNHGFERAGVSELSDTWISALETDGARVLGGSSLDSPHVRRQTDDAPIGTYAACKSDLIWRLAMKWAGMYLVGFVFLVGGIVAALWKMGLLAGIGATWIVIGVVILMGVGIMISVSNSGTKENIQIDRK